MLFIFVVCPDDFSETKNFFDFNFRFSDQVIEQRTEMVSSSSSFTETSTKLGLGISHPKSPHGIVRDSFINSEVFSTWTYLRGFY